MILKNEPLSMAESADYIKGAEVENTEVLGFIHKFTKAKGKDAIKMRQQIKDLEFIQIGDAHIVKIVDLMPGSKEELNKILSNVTMGEDDMKKILDIVSEFK